MHCLPHERKPSEASKIVRHIISGEKISPRGVNSERRREKKEREKEKETHLHCEKGRVMIKRGKRAASVSKRNILQ